MRRQPGPPGENLFCPRSPFQQALPPGAARPDPKRLARRWLWSAALALALLTFFLLVNTELLARDGPGYVIYWLHDHLYLPLKGYVVTRFFPISLFWVGVALTLALLALAAFLTGSAPLKGPQATLSQWVLRRFFLDRESGGRLERLFWNATTRLARRRFEPVFFLEVVLLERSRSRDTFLTTTDAAVQATSLAYLVRSTRIAMRLARQLPSATGRAMRSLAWWQEAHTMLALARWRDSDRDALASLTHLLHGEGEACLSRLAGDRPAVLVGEGSAAAFSVHALAEDTGRPLGDPQPETAGAGPAAHPGNIEPRGRDWPGLARGIAARRACLEAARLVLEEAALAGAGLWDETRAAATLPSLPLKDAVLAEAGELALGIAFEAALAVGDADIALGYLEAVEGLDLALNLAARHAWLAAMPEVTRLTHLTGNLPRPRHYHLAAMIMARAETARERDWFPRFAAHDGPVAAPDVALAGLERHMLVQAAGPAAFAGEPKAERS